MTLPRKGSAPESRLWEVRQADIKMTQYPHCKWGMGGCHFYVGIQEPPLRDGGVLPFRGDVRRRTRLIEMGGTNDV